MFFARDDLGVAFATVAGVGEARAETAPKAAVGARVGKHAVSDAVKVKLETVRALHRQAAEVLGQVKEQAQANEQLWSQIRSARADGQTLRSSFKESHQAALSELKALRRQAAEAETQARQAVKSGDEAAALGALDKVISLEQQAIAKSQQMQQLEQQLGQALQQYISRHPQQ